ncbi:hypothetical protein ACIGNX_13620 [Actinosynnema sp. NPDC053489]|uniref:hypothetical protein n=1 Tax=Actinosynnema sp. NPDC053489 TaxID=3363916 RepID=UPI0037C9672C
MSDPNHPASAGPDHPADRTPPAPPAGATTPASPHQPADPAGTAPSAHPTAAGTGPGAPTTDPTAAGAGPGAPADHPTAAGATVPGAHPAAGPGTPSGHPAAGPVGEPAWSAAGATPHAGRGAGFRRVVGHRATQLVAVGLLGLVLGGGIVALVGHDHHPRHGAGHDRPGHSRFDDRGHRGPDRLPGHDR